MIFLKSVHIYLTAGAVAASYFCFTRINQALLPFIVAVLVTVYLGVLFFIRNRTLLFNSMMVLFLLQLISLKTATFGFIFSLGIGLYIQVGLTNSATGQYLATLSSVDFSHVVPGEHQRVGANLFAFILLLFTMLTKERKELVNEMNYF